MALNALRNSLSILANPKSHSFTTPAAVNSIFSGFISLWMQPCWWQYATPCSVCQTICWVKSSGHPLGYRSNSFNTVLSQNSNTRCNRRFLLNTSNRLTKLGCFRFWKKRILIARMVQNVIKLFQFINCFNKYECTKHKKRNCLKL